jgi:hypothetical protein
MNPSAIVSSPVKIWMSRRMKGGMLLDDQSKRLSIFEVRK